MSQHDMNISNQTFTATRADINAALQALASNNSGATEPSSTYAYQWWADTTTGILKQRNAANSAWINVLNLATGVPTGTAAAGANTDITSLGNNTSTVYTTAGTSTAYTITPNPVIASYAVGQSFVVHFNVASGASPTLQINGIATPPNLVKSNGDGTYSNIAANALPANHRSRVVLISTTQALVEEMPPPFSMVRLQQANGYGSTNNKIARFSSVVTNQGGDIAYADSATLGGSFTVNVAGMYAISFSANLASAQAMGVSRNTTQPTTSIAALTNNPERLAGANSAWPSVSWIGYLAAGDVIRAHTDGNAFAANTLQDFTISRVG